MSSHCIKVGEHAELDAVAEEGDGEGDDENHDNRTMRAAFVIPKRVITGIATAMAMATTDNAAYCGPYDHFQECSRPARGFGQPFRRQKSCQGCNSQAPARGPGQGSYL